METFGPEDFFPSIPPFFNREQKLLGLKPEKAVSVSEKGGLFFNDARTTAAPNHGAVPVPEVVERLLSITDKFLDERAVYDGRVKKPTSSIYFLRGKPFPVDAISLLSNSNSKSKSKSKSNYLVRTTNGEHVPVESLKGKYVMLCCFSVPCSFIDESGFPQYLSHASHELSQRRDFELVLVPKMRRRWAAINNTHNQALYEKFISAFSCLTFPFSQSLRRDNICMSLGFEGYPKAVLLDRNQMVVNNIVSIISRLPPSAFPFTDELASSFRSDLLELCKQTNSVGFEGLLGPNHPYHLLTKFGSKETISISQLKERLLGVYFCTTGDDLFYLYDIYQHCISKGQQLDIVLVYDPYPNDVPFNKFVEIINGLLEVHNIPWWILPFNFSVSLRIGLMLLSTMGKDTLLVVDPNTNYVDDHGLFVAREFGREFFPFTRRTVISKAAERLQKITLKSILTKDFFVHHDKDMPSFENKVVLVYLTGYSLNANFILSTLVKLYDETKVNNSDFEVVVVTQSGQQYHFGPCPLVLCSSESYTSIDRVLSVECLNLGSERIVAFGRDGNVSSINALNRLPCDGPATYPFCGNLAREVFGVLHNYFSDDEEFSGFM